MAQPVGDGPSAQVVQVELVAGALGRVTGLVGGVGDDQWDGPTPCAGFTVRQLVAHMLGWLHVFAAAANGVAPDTDPAGYVLGRDPAGSFSATAASLVEGWRRLGVDRPVRMTGEAELPGPMVLGMTLIEYVTHGWDLATATGQPVPFRDDEVDAALAAARASLQPQYRGAGMPFGEEVPVPDDASPIERLAGFMGRRP